MNTYAIHDANVTTLLSDYPVYTGKTAAEAVKKYISDKGYDCTIRVSGDRDVTFGALPAVIENGKLFLLGYKRKVWFKATRKEPT